VYLAAPQIFLSRFAIGPHDNGIWLGSYRNGLRHVWTFSASAKIEIRERGATAFSVVTHHEHFGSVFAQGLVVKLPGSLVKPARPGFEIVMKAKPEPLKLFDLLAVLTEAEVHNVRYTLLL
jgi:hypothetical protein